MCLAVPMRVEKIEDNVGTVDSAGVKVQADFSLVPEVKQGVAMKIVVKIPL